jgi:hypothetical protein
MVYSRMTSLRVTFWTLKADVKGIFSRVGLLELKLQSAGMNGLENETTTCIDTGA